MVSLEIILIFILILVNGFFAMSEIAVVSARKPRLQVRAKSGDKNAQAALELNQAPHDFLSTVQVGITGIGILSGVFGGARLAVKLQEHLSQFPSLAPYAEFLAFSGVSLTITYFSLVLGELLPKTIALRYPESIASVVARPFQSLARFAKPLVWLLSRSTDLMLGALGFGISTNIVAVTEDEIKSLVQQGTEDGTLNKIERDMVENVLAFGDRKALTLMTPRPEIVWLDVNAPFAENAAKLSQSKHSYFPVARGTLEHVLGIVHVKDLLAETLAGRPHELALSLRQPLFLPETTKAEKILESFQQSGVHIALIVDEYGIMQGLVTLNDIMAEIVGDLPPIHHEREQDQAIRRSDGTWLVDGLMSIDDVKEVLQIAHLPGEENGNFNTIAGFVMTEMGKIPKASDVITIPTAGIRIEVMDMDGNRVDKVLITFLSAEVTVVPEL